MKISETKPLETHDVWKSPVTAVLLHQFRSIQIEGIVRSTSTRVLWFVLLLVFALTPNLSASTFLPLMIIAFTLFHISNVATQRAVGREDSIRKSLVRLDPHLEDHYINTMHDFRDKLPLSFSGMVIWGLLALGEDLLWFVSAILILASRVGLNM